jgi:hypothetical protein
MRPIVVVPAYDEAATIGAVVTAARRYAHVLVVDDGSRDGTAAAAERGGAEVLRHRRRLGKGQALRTGVAAARARGASVVVTLDADGQHDPADIPAILRVAAEPGRAIVIGNRLGAPAELPRGRLNAIRVAGFFVNWVTDRSIEDTQSGFRVYPMALFDEIRPRRGGFVFETEVLMAAAARGFAVREVPVRALARVARRSRFRPIVDGVAVGSYLAARIVARWGVEAGAAARAVASVFGRDRRVARHAKILDAAAPHADTPGAWAAAVGVSVLEQTATRLGLWWRSPRRRRAAVAAWGCIAAPLLLLLASVQALGPLLMPDLVTQLTRRIYDQGRLDAAARDTPRVLEQAAPRPRRYRVRRLLALRGGEE